MTFKDASWAMNAQKALNGTSPGALGHRRLFIQFAEASSNEKGNASITSSTLSCTSTTAQVVIPGLSIIEGFLSPEEEVALIETIDTLPWEESIGRRVQHYGYAFRYDTRDVDVHAPLHGGRMPHFCDDIRNRLTALRPDVALPDQITINEYVPGQGIAPHIDTAHVFTDYVASLSLGSDIIMDFRCAENSSCVKHVLLRRGSLCLMVGEARYAWKHGIAHRKHDLVPSGISIRGRRVSLTMRKVRTSNDTHSIQISIFSSMINHTA